VILPLRRPKPATPPAATSQPPRVQRTREEEDNETRRFYTFLKEEGVVAWLNPTIGNHGTIVAFGPFGRPGFSPPPPPGFNLSVESYNHILRLMQHGVPVKLEMELESEFLDDKGHTSVLGEIRGSDLPGEVVLIGAHLDSWHVGAGATDNGANCAVLIEAMRILKTLKLPLARTVRVALWAGEERGLRGSAAYVKRMSERPAEKLRLYLNADSGAGRYRGLQIQERSDFAPVAENWLAFFFPKSAYLQVKAISDPATDYNQRLIANYAQDVHTMHAQLGANAASAQFVGIDVPSGQAVLVRPGAEYNKGSYWRVYGTTVRYRVDGQERTFPVTSMISWRGQWYVVHLGTIR